MDSSLFHLYLAVYFIDAIVRMIVIDVQRITLSMILLQTPYSETAVFKIFSMIPTLGRPDDVLVLAKY